MKAFLILFLLLGTTMFSQQKFEKEYRINLNEVPLKAAEFIERCNFDKRVKWYAEESQDGKTIEAKSCKEKYKFSVEFDKNGDILDIEKRIKWKEVDKPVQNIIKRTLSTRFKKYSIKKIQVHWKASESDYIRLINNEIELNTTFEIVVKGTKNNTTKLFEFLINDKGNILKELQFAPQNNDNIEF